MLTVLRMILSDLFGPSYREITSVTSRIARLARRIPKLLLELWRIREGRSR